MDNKNSGVQVHLEGQSNLNDQYESREDPAYKCYQAAKHNFHYFALLDGGKCLGVRGSQRRPFVNARRSDECSNSKGGKDALTVYVITG